MPLTVKYNEAQGRLEVSFSNTKHFRDLLDLCKEYELGFDGEKWIKYKIENLKPFMNEARRMEGLTIKTYGEPAKAIKEARDVPDLAVDLGKDNNLVIKPLRQHHEHAVVSPESKLNRLEAEKIEGKWYYKGEWEELAKSLQTLSVEWDERVVKAFKEAGREHLL